MLPCRHCMLPCRHCMLPYRHCCKDLTREPQGQCLDSVLWDKTVFCFNYVPMSAMLLILLENIFFCRFKSFTNSSPRCSKNCNNNFKRTPVIHIQCFGVILKLKDFFLSHPYAHTLFKLLYVKSNLNMHIYLLRLHVIALIKKLSQNLGVWMQNVFAICEQFKNKLYCNGGGPKSMGNGGIF